MQVQSRLTHVWPSRALPHDDIKLSAAAFRPGILGFRVTVTPRLLGSVTLARWSHRFSLAVEPMGCPKEGTFCFQLALVSNGGSTEMIGFFRGCVNFFSFPFVATLSHDDSSHGPMIQQA
jgi:hypothetical protein